MSNATNEQNRRENTQPYRNAPLGAALQVCGALLMAACGAYFLLRGALKFGLTYSMLVTLVLTFAGVIGFSLYIYGKKLCVALADEVLARDSRPPVIYLRSFRDDDEEQFPMLGFWPTPTTEQQLSTVLSKVGPVIAIGRPGEREADLGAYRKYVLDQDWKEEISALLATAGVVILRVGHTDGFWWEVKRVIEEVAPNKILFFFGRQATTAEHYAVFRERVTQLLPHPPPEKLGEAYFLAFDNAWTPLPMGTAKNQQKTEQLHQGTTYLEADLKPFLARYGIKARRAGQPSSALVALAIAFGAIFAVVIIGVLVQDCLEENERNQWKKAALDSPLGGLGLMREHKTHRVSVLNPHPRTAPTPRSTPPPANKAPR